jgi:acetyltransferase
VVSRQPVDIIGDAQPDRYRAAIEAVAADPATDVVMVMNCPTGLGSPSAAASAVARLARDGKIAGKPVLTCWLGEQTARQGRRILQDGGIASFETPADAAMAVSYLSDWSRAQRALLRTPSRHAEDGQSNREAVLAIFRQVASQGRRMLTEPEAKAAISGYGIPVPETIVAGSPAEVVAAAGRLLGTSPQVVVKLLSKAVSHKSEVGGVVLGIATAAAAGEAAHSIEARLRQLEPKADIQGFAVQPMVTRKQAQELILGVSRDPIFGPVLLFGAGGVAVEVTDDTAVALPPLDDILAGDLIAHTRIGRLLAGFRDRKPADREAIVAALNSVSRMVVDFPCLVSMDINPLLADHDGVVALDARIEIEPGLVDLPDRTRHWPSGPIRPAGTGTLRQAAWSITSGRSGRPM